MNNPGAYCITYHSHLLGMVGGIRVEIANPAFDLPIVSAVGKYDGSLGEEVRGKQDMGIGEVCGMWTDRRVAGIGVGNGLVRFSLFTLIQTQTYYGICLVTDYTKMLVTRYGFNIADQFGNNGTFEYPDERYLATVMMMDDTKLPQYRMMEEAKIGERLAQSHRNIREKIDSHFVNLDITTCFNTKG